MLTLKIKQDIRKQSARIPNRQIPVRCISYLKPTMDYDLLANPPGNLTEYAFMQYNFTKGRRTPEPQPHRTSKSVKAFLPRQESTKEGIKKLSQASRPKEVFHQIIEEKFGVRHLSYPGQHARSYQQVSGW